MMRMLLEIGMVIALLGGLFFVSKEMSKESRANRLQRREYPGDDD